MEGADMQCIIEKIFFSYHIHLPTFLPWQVENEWREVKGFRVFEYKGGSTDMGDGVSCGEMIYYYAKRTGRNTNASASLTVVLVDSKLTSDGCENGIAPSNSSLLVAFFPVTR
jgi:hypothetical protein